MFAPHSYTGEDCVELHLHGSPLLLTEVVLSLQATGLVRGAEPGEFSFRAVVNGKMDLSQAEGVVKLIEAKSREGIESAVQTLRGEVRTYVNGLKERLADFLAQIELEIDFSDQEVPSLCFDDLARGLKAWEEDLEGDRKIFLRSEPLREGLHTAIVGAPNSGKSTFFNMLLGEDRSIVTNKMGTTRDVVHEFITIGGMTLRVADTAGLRESEDEIEKLGIERSLGEVENAQLVVFVLDGTEVDQLATAAVESRIHAFKTRNKNAMLLLVLNKVDCLSTTETETFLNNLRALGMTIAVSAKHEEGLVPFESALQELVQDLRLAAKNNRILNRRHFELLGSAGSSVQRVVTALGKGERRPDLLSVDLREAMDSLGEVTGEISSDAILERIFARFCIGK